jgi:hypothetical protein
MGYEGGAVMGYAQRAREARTELQSAPYRVQFWSTLPWGTADEQRTKDRKANLMRISRIVERRLLDLCPDLEPVASVMTVKDMPQIRLAFVVRAPSPEDARDIVYYHLLRAMKVKVPYSRTLTGAAHKAALEIPWGRVEVKHQQQRRRKVA